MALSRWKKGQSGNPNGRIKGAETFKTRWFRYIDFVAKSRNTTPEMIENELYFTALSKIKEGSFNYWKDINDRVYGTPANNVNLNNDISFKTVSDEELNKKIADKISELL